jgi:hypothetical protein
MHRAHEQRDELGGHIERLNQHALARLHTHRMMHQHICQFLPAGVDHSVYSETIWVSVAKRALCFFSSSTTSRSVSTLSW